MNSGPTRIATWRAGPSVRNGHEGLCRVGCGRDVPMLLVGAVSFVTFACTGLFFAFCNGATGRAGKHRQPTTRLQPTWP